MTSVDLDQIGKLRWLREQKLRAAMARENQRLMHAKASTAAAAASLQKHIKFQIQREREMSEQMIGRVVKPLEIELRRMESEILRERRTALSMDLQRMQDEEHEIQVVVDQAQAAWQRAQRDAERVDHVNQRQLKQARAKADAVAENESLDTAVALGLHQGRFQGTEL